MKTVAKIALKFFLLLLGTQFLFWIILIIFPETGSKNIGQEIGYRYIDELVSKKSSERYSHLVAGDSSAATAISSKTLFSDSVSLGVWGSSPAEVYYYVSRYLETHPAPNCIIYTHLNAPDYYSAHTFWDFVVPYADLPLSFIDEIYEKSKELNTFPGNHYIKPVFYAKYFLIKYKFFLFSQGIYLDKIVYSFTHKDAYQKTWAVFNEFNGQYARRVKTRGIRKDWLAFLADPFKKDPYFDYYANKLFSLIESKGIKLYTFTPPFEKTLYQKYHERMKAMENYLESTTAHYKNAKYISLKEFYPEEYYIDQGHLNRMGAKNFTTDIADQLHCQ